MIEIKTLRAFEMALVTSLSRLPPRRTVMVIEVLILIMYSISVKQEEYR